MRLICVTVGLLVLVLGCTSVDTNSKLSPAQLDELATYVSEHGQAPADYVIDKFHDHLIIIIGEQHRIKHDVEFVGGLIPTLYDNGIYHLATEFGRREDQPLIDSLLARDEWDEMLAREIGFKQFVHWGYREYLDIYKAAWALNSQLPDTARKFSIIAMGNSPDWSVMEKPEDRDVDSLKRLVWHGERESDWAEPVLAAVADGNKVLVHCGIHHGFSRYLQPKLKGDGTFSGYYEEDRVGRHLYNACGDSVMTIFMHAMWSGPGGYGDDWVRPADGIIDTVMALLGPEHYPVGFDIVNSPLTDIVIENAVYKRGYVPFTLDEFCDGWIYHRPFSEYDVVTAIDGFYTEDNIDWARAQSPNPRFRDASIEDFENALQRTLDGHRQRLREL
ncbi:hypothetical protein GF420_11490 [candidate division GN15 bacterium]|nr:hypothetical protein [candidate division GN15 bacterium]